MNSKKSFEGSRHLSPTARRVVTAALVAATIGAPTVALAAEPAATSQAPAPAETPSQSQGTTSSNDTKNDATQDAFQADGKEFSTFSEALAAAAKAADKTVTITKSTTDNLEVTKEYDGEGITIMAAQGVEVHGQLVIEAKGVTVKGVHFVLDNDSTGTLSVKANNGTTVTGCTFDITGTREGQLNSIWAAYVSDVTVSCNTFNIAVNATDQSWVGINLVGSTNADGSAKVKNVKIDGNTLNALPPVSKDWNVNKAPNLFLVIANGNASKEGDYGIQDLVATNNKSFDKTGVAKPNTLVYGISFNNVNEGTFTGNEFEGYMGFSRTGWPNEPTSAGVTITGNTLDTEVGLRFRKSDIQDGQLTLKDNTFGENNKLPVDGNAAFSVVNEGTGKTYASLSDALKEANAGDTLKLLQDSSESTTVDKTLTLTAAKGVTFSGALRINAYNVTVKGMSFKLDPATNKNAQNVIVSGKATGVTVTDNTFTIEAGNPADGASKNKDWQPSSVWLENGATNTSVKGNTFKLGQVVNNTAVGVNIIGNGNLPITGTTIADNTMASGPKSGEGTSGSMMLVVGNGNTSKEQGEKNIFGIVDTTISGNTVKNETGLSADASRTYAFAVTATKNTVIDGNTTEGYAAVSYSVWPKQGPNDGLKVTNNKLDAFAGVLMGDYVTEGGLTVQNNTFGEETKYAYNGASICVTNQDGKAYSSVAEAIEAGATTVTLLQDVTGDINIPSGKTVTVDLAGKSFTVSKGKKVTNKGTLVITDSSKDKNGSVKVENGASISNDGTILIEGGKFTGDLPGNPGNVEIKGGTFSADPSMYVVSGFKAVQTDKNTWEVRKASNPGGGGGSVTPAPSRYDVTVNKADNGTVTADKASAAKGEKVTVTAAPADGYRVSGVTVTDASGNAVEVAAGSDGAYTFEMPASKVTVSATFESQARRFSDADYSMWYGKALDFVSARGIMGGYPNGTFGVGKSLTRYELAQLLYKYSGGKDDPAAKNSTGMADVADGQWYTAAANWAVKNGVVNGYPQADGSRAFGGDRPVSTEELVAIVGNLVKADFSKADPSVLDGFRDPDAVDGWARQAVAWAVQSGLINGSVEADGTYIRPTGDVARERVVAIVMNAIEKGVLK